MLRNQKTYSNKYETYALPKANPGFAIYKFHEEKKMSEIAEISGYNHLLQSTWKAGRWHGDSDWVRQGCVGGLTVLSCRSGDLSRALWSPGSTGSRWTSPLPQPQFVMSGCASPTIRTSSPASQPGLLRRGECLSQRQEIPARKKKKKRT